MPASSPPGWFPDPYGAAGLQRYWDGQDWTQATQPVDVEPGFLPPLAGPSMHGSSPYDSPGYDPYAVLQPQPGPFGARTGLPATRPNSNSGLMWVLGGGAGLVVIVIIAVGVVIGLRSSDGPGPLPPTSQSVPTSPAPGGTTSRTVGRIADSKAGFSYAKLGSPWAEAAGSWFSPGFFSAGQVSIVQAPFEEYASFNATSLSGVPRSDESSGYSGPGDLSTVTGRVTERILNEHFNMTKTRTDLGSRAYSVSGRSAWVQKFRLDFIDAKARGWKFSADTVAIMVIDLGGRRLGLLWVSVPDTFPGQGDVDLVLASTRVP